MNSLEPPLQFERKPITRLGIPNGMADREPTLERFTGVPDAKGSEVRKWEKPWHRVAVHMYAGGSTKTAIAEACDVGINHVSALAKNKWFQELVIELQKINGLDDIMDRFRSESNRALDSLIELRDAPLTPAAVKVNINFGLLHQVLGKPTQRVETKTEPRSADPVAEVARLEEEQARLLGSLRAATLSPDSTNGEPPLAQVSPALPDGSGSGPRP